MPRIRYDQRVLVLVEVRGEQRDWDEAERVFDQQGWPVVTAFARGEGASRGVLSEADPARLYSVEVRFFGARNRRTELAATWRVEWLARAAGLEMYARRCELVDRDREQLTGWRAHTVVAHRPPRAPVPRPRTSMEGLHNAAVLARAPRRGVATTTRAWWSRVRCRKPAGSPAWTCPAVPLRGLSSTYGRSTAGSEGASCRVATKIVGVVRSALWPGCSP